MRAHAPWVHDWDWNTSWEEDRDMTPLEGMAERAAERAVSEREAERRAIERAVPRIEEYPVPCWCRWLAEKQAVEMGRDAFGYAPPTLSTSAPVKGAKCTSCLIKELRGVA